MYAEPNRRRRNSSSASTMAQYTPTNPGRTRRYHQRQLAIITKPVTIKALVRVCADLSRTDGDPAEGRVKRWEERLSAWKDQQRAFRSEGFYERFPAKGQIERVARIHRDLARWAGIEVRSSAKSRD